MKRTWKIILGTLVLLAAGGFVAFQLLQAPEVEVQRAALSNIRRSITEEGLVVPREERALLALQTARIEELLVEEGERVERGDLLAVLDDTELQHSLEALRAQLSSLEGEKMQLREEPGAARLESLELSIAEAEKSLAAAQRNLERMETLYRETYELGVKEARESLQSAERQYRRAEQLFAEGIAPRAEYEEARDMLVKAENYLARQELARQVFSEAEYEQAEELVRQAEFNLAQQEKALLVLHESYRPARGSFEVIEAQKRALQAQVDLLKYQLSHYRLTSPLSGVVSQVTAREGEITGPHTYLMKLFQEEDCRVEVRVLVRDIYDIAVGMPVRLTLDLREREIIFPGEVLKMAPRAEKDFSPLGLEEERVKVTIIPDFPEDVQIAPGFRLDVEFTTEEQEGKIVVPKTALFTYRGEDALLVVENERLSIRPVKTGLETRQEAVITKGLEEGELVVLDPQGSALEAGARVSCRIAGE